jgi:serine/threonine protein phosphatase PrpC
LKLTQATLSHAGGRKINEDASGHLTRAAGQGCWVVADGLGGHGGGDVASRIVVDTMLDAYRSQPDFSSAHLGKMLEFAQYALSAQQQDNDRLSAMRSTVVVLLLEEAKAWWAHVGDSRLYHFSNERIVFQTKDHSVPQVMVDAGDIAYEDIRQHEDRNRLTRSLGNDGKVRSTLLAKPVAISAGDAFLLCTDGFWEFVSEADMEATLAQADSPENWLAAMEVILLHNAPTRHDNYTATALFLESMK